MFGSSTRPQRPSPSFVTFTHPPLFSPSVINKVDLPPPRPRVLASASNPIFCPSPTASATALNRSHGTRHRRQGDWQRRPPHGCPRHLLLRPLGRLDRHPRLGHGLPLPPPRHADPAHPRPAPLLRRRDAAAHVLDRRAAGLPVRALDGRQRRVLDHGHLAAVRHRPLPRLQLALPVRRRDAEALRLGRGRRRRPAQGPQQEEEDAGREVQAAGLHDQDARRGVHGHVPPGKQGHPSCHCCHSEQTDTDKTFDSSS